MADIRRDRRRAKDENEILLPLIEYLDSNPKLRNQLALVQGKCATKIECHGKRQRGTAVTGELIV